MFNGKELDIVIQCNMKSVNYLDITLKRLPISIESRLSSLPSSEEIFNDSVTPYHNALDKSRYKHKLKYQARWINTTNDKKQRERNIIWFNPPHNKNVKTNIRLIFLNVIKKHFPPHRKFHKLFNKNTVKISCNCTRNIKITKNSHNAKIYSLKKVQNKEHVIT